MLARPALSRLQASRPALALLRQLVREQSLPWQEGNYTCDTCLHKRRQSDWVASPRSGGLQDVLLPYTSEDEGQTSEASSQPSSRFRIQRFEALQRIASKIKLQRSQGEESDEQGKDDDRNRRDHLDEDQCWKYLLEQIQHEGRRHGMGAARSFFETLFLEKIDLPTTGRQADNLWDFLLQIGFADHSFLPQIVSYAKDLKTRTTRSWDHLYGRSVGHALRVEARTASHLHSQLAKDFPPTLEDYKELFRLSLLSRQNALSCFEQIYRDFPVRGMYAEIVQNLCEKRMFECATRWHSLLLEAGDTPRDFTACKPLLVYYARIKDDLQVERLVRSLADAQVWFERSVNQFIRHNQVVSREMLNRALGEAYSIAPKPISDQFCARLFATRAFTVDLVISGLQAIGTESIGPASMREIVARSDCIGSRVLAHLDSLRKADITVKDSKYTSMLRKAAVEGRTKTMVSIIECDLHPDAFEDIALQERLLATYHQAKDRGQFQRTMEILLHEVSRDQILQRRNNLLLRCYVQSQDRPQMHATLESMLQSKVHLDAKSARVVQTMLLSSRTRSKAPQNSLSQVRDLLMVINLLKNTVESGELLYISVWKEMLKRLGLLGRLRDYENLALWIVAKYAAAPISSSKLQQNAESMRMRARRGSTAHNSMRSAAAIPSAEVLQHSISSRRIGSNRRQDAMTFDVPQDPPFGSSQNLISSELPDIGRDKSNHFQFLFDISAQQSILAWGFQSEVKGRPHLLKNRTTEEVRHTESPADWQWGLRFLKTLSLQGVPINKATVARACKQRLLQLFDTSGQSKRVINRQAKALNDLRAETDDQYRYSAYVRGMKEVWGEDLFAVEDGAYSLHGKQGSKWQILELNQVSAAV